MGKIEQQVAHSRRRCNLSHTLNLCSGKMTSMVYLYIKHSSLGLQFRMLPCALELMKSLAGAMDLMES
jgi:hypothetical protein